MIQKWIVRTDKSEGDEEMKTTVMNVTTSGGYVAVTVVVVPKSSYDEPKEPQVPISDEEEATERERLKDLLAWEAYGSTPLADDLNHARQIDAFVKDAIGVHGEYAHELLRDEAYERYGRKARAMGILEKFPEVDHRGLDWATGCDIMPVAFWAGWVIRERAEVRRVTHVW